MKIPQTAPQFDEETIAAVSDVLRSGWVTEGAQCEAFTAELLEYMHAPYGCLVSNGTMALELALRALGIGDWGLILVPDMTFAATANAVVAVGARPYLVDSYDATLEQYNSIPVWLFGNRPAWTTNANIEDAAQAIGCWHEGKHAGTFGHVGCFSFYADKTITTGEGGFVVCKDVAVYERLEQLRNHGRARGTRGYGHEAFGINGRMTDIQAAIGRQQLRHLPEYIAARLGHWNHYAGEIGGIARLAVMSVSNGSVAFRCVIMVPDPVALAAYLAEYEIETRRMFLPLHRQAFLSRYVRAGQTFPNADYAYDHGLLLPCHQSLSDMQVQYVCDKVKEFYRG